MSKKNQTKLFERVADGIYQRRTGGLCWRPKKDGQRTWEKLHHHYRSQGKFAEPDFLIEYAESSSFSGKRDFDTCYM
jgi:hypothetical protein